ncbi:OTU domain-containing 3 isoform X1 [Chlorella sorokiniana]|uniref:OTU domain-containing 3 isoform X1 n=1 Tax=Chlorella sorokiniana TaxID=3076 RepID=A0A2P6TKT4_CHLSO|nr:OTU domain-containing 3 isoform X1 [Chlorella sorokiniana]|eukprot:PRW44889.1 OTU domain-containing 3 isoform X1 [Chlorella sorokiniana]
MGKQHKAKAAKKGGSTAAAAAAAAPERQERQKGKGKARRSKKDVHHYGGDDLERELAAVGLRIKQIEADGNCFFRSVLDQLEGEGGDHLRLRQRVMEYVEEQEEDYKFFMEDDEPFDKYIKRMKKEGAWAGHLELQATSLLLERNICIYQSGQPVWRISNFDQAPEEETLHLSYHDGMHYNSVRNADDYGSGPPEPVRMRSTGTSAAAETAAAAGGEPSFGAAEVDQVVAGTGCFDRERIWRMLEQCGGSVEQAIELLIEQLGQEEPEEPADGGDGSGGSAGPSQQQAAAQRDAQQLSLAGSDAQQAGGSTGAAAECSQQAAGAAEQQQQQQLGDDSIRLELQLRPDDPSCIRVVLTAADAGREQQQQQAAGAAAADSTAATEADSGDKRSGKRASKGIRLKHKPEHPGRNQRCPCGSGKKVKNCCGALRGKRGAAAIGRSADADEADSSAAAATVQLQVLHI